ncbi:MAG: hypothetical protein LBU84_18045 [Prevotella sp.]|jgi:hypothetical protein|nr:hypothetical protein [Prevotella sp.]
MRKLILFILLPILTACDPFVYMELYVQNNCDQSITVQGSAEHYPSTEFYITIKPHSTELIYQCETINHIEKSDIPHFITSLNIVKEGEIFNANPLDTNRWTFEEITPYKFGKSHFRSKATIFINSGDFE